MIYTAKVIMFSLLVKFTSSFMVDVAPYHKHPHVNIPPHEIEEMYCLSLNTYFETRGQSFKSKIAVAETVMNRVHNKSEFKRYNDVCSIVEHANYHHGRIVRNECWYSWYCDGKPDIPNIYYRNGEINVMEMKAWKKSVLASFYAYKNLYPDIVGKATHYYNYKIAHPPWAHSYKVVTKIGEMVFLN